ncbi:hypothetical protein RCL_jg14739.t1 [Rhizophagus clarus]|uniref:Uncharacterized protein n=1 Tax=Rhizophagus clarus TaxID=94130 RepID=A0A8H3QZ17_9GLOM|nr:hypothetical protein RCL_jg14739.t1 [Rhizophagus clarus]
MIRNLTIGNINLGVKKSIPTGSFNTIQLFLGINLVFATNLNIIAVPLSSGNLYDIATSNVSLQNTQPAYPITQLVLTDNTDLLVQLLQGFNQILFTN